MFSSWRLVNCDARQLVLLPCRSPKAKFFMATAPYVKKEKRKKNKVFQQLTDTEVNSKHSVFWVFYLFIASVSFTGIRLSLHPRRHHLLTRCFPTSFGASPFQRSDSDWPLDLASEIRKLHFLINQCMQMENDCLKKWLYVVYLQVHVCCWWVSLLKDIKENWISTFSDVPGCLPLLDGATM